MAELPKRIYVPITEGYSVVYVREQTCFNMSHSASTHDFTCSECGIMADVFSIEVGGDTVRYCPGCGRKVEG